MISITTSRAGLLVLFAILVAASGAAADSIPYVYGFTSSPSGNIVGDVQIGQSQLFVKVSDASEAGQGKVQFHFYNTGPYASSICDIYFADGTLYRMENIIDGPNVDFEKGANPGDLPAGGNSFDAGQTEIQTILKGKTPTVVYSVTDAEDYSASSIDPTQPNGVNPGEWVDIIWTLQTGKTYQDAISALNAGVGASGNQPGILRIGIHVQGFATGGSESFVNGPGTPVPLPTPLLAGTALLAGWAAWRRVRLGKLA